MVLMARGFSQSARYERLDLVGCRRRNVGSFCVQFAYECWRYYSSRPYEERVDVIPCEAAEIHALRQRYFDLVKRSPFSGQVL